MTEFCNKVTCSLANFKLHLTRFKFNSDTVTLCLIVQSSHKQSTGTNRSHVSNGAHHVEMALLKLQLQFLMFVKKERFNCLFCTVLDNTQAQITCDIERCNVILLTKMKFKTTFHSR